jgi:hypothetical protein
MSINHEDKTGMAVVKKNTSALSNGSLSISPCLFLNATSACSYVWLFLGYMIYKLLPSSVEAPRSRTRLLFRVHDGLGLGGSSSVIPTYFLRTPDHEVRLPMRSGAGNAANAPLKRGGVI